MKNRDQIQEEALKILLPLKRAGIGVTMGGGKTLIGLRHMDANYNDYCKFLVVAPKLSILDEWKSQADQHGLSHLKEHMHFTTYLSLTKELYDYDVIYLDECHSLLFSHEAWLNGYTGKIVGLTGTPPKFKGSEKGEMVDKFCPIVYRYVTDSAVEDKILNDYRIVVHTLTLDPIKNILVEKNGKQWYTSELAQYDYWSYRLQSTKSKKEAQIVRVMRMKALMDFRSKEKLAKKIMDASTNKLIVFANTQEQADRLCSHSYHSNNPDSESNLTAFKSDMISRLSCVLQLNEGVNIPNLKEGIILHAYGNERKASQRIGRLLRLNPNDCSIINILCYKKTVDETWVENALSDFDKSKISYINH